MSFLSNYLWIFMIIILVALAVIGYIAEKNDFINKQTNKKKDQNNIDFNQIAETGVNPENTVSEQAPSVNDVDIFSEPQNEDLNKGLNDAFEATMDDSEKKKNSKKTTRKKKTKSTESISELKSTNESNNDEIPSDLYTPLENNTQKSNEEEIPNDLYAPLEGSVEKNNSEEIPSELYAPLETLQSTDEKVVDFSDDDDDEVWKF